MVKCGRQLRLRHPRGGTDTHDDPHKTRAARKAAQALFVQKNHFRKYQKFINLCLQYNSHSLTTQKLNYIKIFNQYIFESQFQNFCWILFCLRFKECWTDDNHAAYNSVKCTDYYNCTYLQCSAIFLLFVLLSAHGEIFCVSGVKEP